MPAAIAKVDTNTPTVASTSIGPPAAAELLHIDIDGSGKQQKGEEAVQQRRTQIELTELMIEQ